MRLFGDQFRSRYCAQSDEGRPLVGGQFRGRCSVCGNQHRAGDAVEKRTARRRNWLGGMALPGFDAGIRLRAATESPLVPVFYETDPVRETERISQVARVFVKGSIYRLN